jgi:tRNA 2-selenouridine synthase
MATELPIETDFARIFIEQIPLLDVRAPIEFEAGAFPNSENIPLLNNEERHLVGIRYKQQGQSAAIALGYELVDEAKKQHRLAQWQKFFLNHPDGMLYCFRGGLRSRLSQTMLAHEVGITVPRLAGGYKAMRRFLINTLEFESMRANFIVIGGRTGSGKTEFIQTYRRILDLEAIANHKGSAFGQEIEPQPSQIDIDHHLSIQLLRLNKANAHTAILLEDEGAKIGARRLPKGLWEAMQNAPLIILQTPIEQRITRVFNEYIVLKRQKLMQNLGNEDTVFKQQHDELIQSLSQIQRRLGDERYRQYRSLATEGMNDFFQKNNAEKLNLLIEKILTQYYDPMYDYQISKKTARIQFGGSAEAVRSWLTQSSV